MALKSFPALAKGSEYFSSQNQGEEDRHWGEAIRIWGESLCSPLRGRLSSLVDRLPHGGRQGKASPGSVHSTASRDGGARSLPVCRGRGASTLFASLRPCRCLSGRPAEPMEEPEYFAAATAEWGDDTDGGPVSYTWPNGNASGLRVPPSGSRRGGRSC